MSEADREALRWALSRALARWQHGGKLRRQVLRMIWPALAEDLTSAFAAAVRDGHR